MPEGAGVAVPPTPPLSPRRHTARWAAVTAAVILVLFVAILATRRSAESKLADSPLLGHGAPAVAGTSVFGGGVSLSQFQGKWVLVNFLASWCVPCRQEHPELVKFSQRHGQDGQILGVIYDDSSGNVRAFFSELGGDWPVIGDPDGRIALDYGVRGPPESFLISPRGLVLTKFTGQVSADEVDRLIVRYAAAGV